VAGRRIERWTSRSRDKRLRSSSRPEVALDRGKRFCFLYTDLANPTSNAIYMRLGYRPVCDSREIAFAAESG
jgi:hypothetical protein